MEPFATVEDLEARWRPLDPSEGARAEALIGDASALIARSMRASGAPIDGGDALQARALRAVCCAVVRRCMCAPVDGPAVSNASQTVGPFSQSFAYAAPSGDMYLTSGEKRELGIGRARVGSIPARVAPRGAGGRDA